MKPEDHGGLTPELLADIYPRLYHMAEVNSWDSIQRHGLLSTSALLDFFGYSGPERERIESARRPVSVVRHEQFVAGDWWQGLAVQVLALFVQVASDQFEHRLEAAGVEGRHRSVGGLAQGLLGGLLDIGGAHQLAR